MTTTIDVIYDIVKDNNDIRNLSLVAFGGQRDIRKDKKWNDQERLTFDKALELRNNYGLPFWEALMITQLDIHLYSERILKSSNHHNNIRYVKSIKPEELNVSYSLLSNFGLNSKVTMEDSEIKHIPMIDFRVPYSELGTKIVTVICNELGQSGYILNSGKSYHFIGKNLLPYSDFVSFLGRSLLYSPLVDTTWVGHQLIDGSATLRIGSKNGTVPLVVKKI